MPVNINGDTYYRTAEVCRATGISRNTLFRWVRAGSVLGVEHRDCRGWRVFTIEQVEALKRHLGEIKSFETGVR